LTKQESYNRELITQLRRRRVVVLSPHFDDACLSIGGILSALGSGTLVNIFTRSLFLKQGPPPPRNEEQVRAIREAEDLAFCNKCGLSRHDLRCLEPAITGRHPSDHSHLETDVAEATKPLLSKIEELANGSEKAILLAPVGIGPNVNHLATAQIIARNLPAITRKYEPVFYEELPYAARPLERLRALRALRHTMRPQGLTRRVFRIDWPAKEALIGLYPSQFPPPVSRARFRPAALWPIGFHEAIWSANEGLI